MKIYPLRTISLLPFNWIDGRFCSWSWPILGQSDVIYYRCNDRILSCIVYKLPCDPIFVPVIFTWETCDPICSWSSTPHQCVCLNCVIFGPIPQWSNIYDRKCVVLRCSYINININTNTNIDVWVSYLATMLIHPSTLQSIYTSYCTSWLTPNS